MNWTRTETLDMRMSTGNSTSHQTCAKNCRQIRDAEKGRQKSCPEKNRATEMDKFVVVLLFIWCSITLELRRYSQNLYVHLFLIIKKMMTPCPCRCEFTIMILHTAFIYENIFTVEEGLFVKT